MASELDYSTTASSNSAINGVGIAGTDLPSNLDNAMREMAANTAAAQPRTTLKNGNYTAVKDDFGKTFVFSGASRVLTISQISALASGWNIYVEADASNAMTISRSGSNTLNGATSLTLPAGRRCRVFVSNSSTDIKVDFERNQADDFYTGSSSSFLNYPIGEVVAAFWASSPAPPPNLNSTRALYLASGFPYLITTDSTGNTLLPGTWIVKGSAGGNYFLARKIAN